jgi:hypothetical protein
LKLAPSNIFHSKTQKALLWMNLSGEPFVVLYATLSFILRKDCGADLWQICILTALRPVLPVFSFYWSANLTHRRDRLRSNLIGAWVLGRVPFLFIPWIDSVWYVIFCCAMYEFFNRSGIPALIEILKINMTKDAREKTYTFYFVLSFIESILLGLFMGGILDIHPKSWQFLTALMALLGLSSVFAQLKVPLPFDPVPAPPKKVQNPLIQPWKDAFTLLKNRPDFAHFQYGFMIGGFGLMIMAPSLAILYANDLSLSHTQVITGRSIFMGIGVVLSSYFWKKALSRSNVSNMSLKILIGFGLFPLILLLAKINLSWFYLSFIFYGVAQAGSHLLWNLSGTLFAKEEDSSQFSRVNILMVGIRGIFASLLGGLLCKVFGPVPTLVLGGLICFMGAIYMAPKP